VVFILTQKYYGLSFQKWSSQNGSPHLNWIENQLRDFPPNPTIIGNQARSPRKTINLAASFAAHAGRKFAILPICHFGIYDAGILRYPHTILAHAENCVDTPPKPWKLTCLFAGTPDRRTSSHWYAPAAVRTGTQSPMEHTAHLDPMDHPAPPAVAVFRRVYPRCRSSVTVVRLLPLFRPPRGSSSTCRTPMPPCKEPPIATVRGRVRGRHCETIHNAAWNDPSPSADPLPFSLWSKSPRPCKKVVGVTRALGKKCNERQKYVKQKFRSSP